MESHPFNSAQGRLLWNPILVAKGATRMGHPAFKVTIDQRDGAI